jgi:hypothetical protein
MRISFVESHFPLYAPARYGMRKTPPCLLHYALVTSGTVPWICFPASDRECDTQSRTFCLAHKTICAYLSMEKNSVYQVNHHANIFNDEIS